MTDLGYFAAVTSSATDEWATPQGEYDLLNREFGPFTLDVCATAENAKCPACRRMNNVGEVVELVFVVPPDPTTPED